MLRKANSSVQFGWRLFTVLIILSIGAIGYAVLGIIQDPYRTIPELDTTIYFENSNSIRGNTYKASAVIQNSLAWSRTSGRLFSVSLSTNTGSILLPILVPSSLNHVNVQKGQKYRLVVQVDSMGILRVQQMEKV